MSERAIIVVADDEDDLRAMYSAALMQAGHTVWEAADGREALELVRAQGPSLLLLDVWMPKLNGFEVLEQLQLDPLVDTLKLVMLSNLGDSDTRLESFSAGVTDFWVKGLSLADLVARVEQVLAAVEVMPDVG